VAPLSRRGAVDEPDDVFWLRREELDGAAADHRRTPSSSAAAV
jgi:hypothetical protein